MEPTAEKLGLVVVEERVRREEPAQLPAATSLMQALAHAASDPRTNIDNMERLFAMHQTMVHKQAEAEFNDAMARAQQKILPVANNALNTHTSSRYAKLAAINKVITPIYTAEGINISFDSYKPEFDKDGKEINAPAPGMRRTIAIVSKGGYSRKHHYDLPLDEAGAKGNVNKTGVQAAGSTSSYARRYLVCMIFNVTTEDDNDGNKPIKEMGSDEQEGFAAQIEAAPNGKELEALWASIAAACTKAGDVAAYEELKKQVIAKAKALKKAEATAI